jgi:bifunctional enzyme CysN/CysC
MSAALAVSPKTQRAETPRPLAAPLAPAKSLLRFITCGSVDDGKSTLLGRLLHETGGVYEDQFSALERDSRKFGTTGEEADFALLVDGLAAEREQGITIDVAYRYFSTEKRGFIAADTPGHEQYTRNMATGASTADLAVILIDARKGVLDQTRRHAYIVSMMGVRQLVLAVNKMDLVGYDRTVFERIERDFRALAGTFGDVGVTTIPVSARAGDNVASASSAMPWYAGPTLLDLLETMDADNRTGQGFRLPVQWVNRPNAEFRGYAGLITGGEVRPGDVVNVLPAGRSATIDRIVTQNGDLSVAVAGQSVTLTFREEVDVSRGAVIASGTLPAVTNAAVATLLAVGEGRIEAGRSYWLKIGTALIPARIGAIRHAIDVHSYARNPAAALAMNAIGEVTLAFETPVVIEPFAATPELGGFILIDRFSNETVAMGIITATGIENETAAAVLPGKAPAWLTWLFAPNGEDLPGAIRSEGGWRLLSAIVVGALVLIASGNAGWAGAAALGDLVLRLPLRRAYESLFGKLAKAKAEKRTERLSSDGSDI